MPDAHDEEQRSGDADVLPVPTVWPGQRNFAEFASVLFGYQNTGHCYFPLDRWSVAKISTEYCEELKRCDALFPPYPKVHDAL
jgi:hypothetical protein